LSSTLNESIFLHVAFTVQLAFDFFFLVVFFSFFASSPEVWEVFLKFSALPVLVFRDQRCLRGPNGCNNDNNKSILFSNRSNRSLRQQPKKEKQLIK
jgi:hypothetical protein